MVSCEDGRNDKNQRIFCGIRNNKRPQRILFQCRGGADNPDIGFTLWFSKCETDTPMGIKQSD
jgi:hypothetical protein